MGNKSTNATAKETTTPDLSDLMQELVTELQSRSRTRADACLLRSKIISEKMLSLEQASSSLQKEFANSSNSCLFLPTPMTFDRSIQQLLELLDSVESCRLQIPEKHRPPSFEVPRKE